MCRRIYKEFIHKEAVFRICCEDFAAVTEEIVRQRQILESYINSHPEFGKSFESIGLLADAPLSAQKMAHAADRVGTGPMAAVAGTMAQLAAQAGLDAGADEVIVENGGDIYLQAKEPIVIELFAGSDRLPRRLGFSLKPEDTPISICSSSGKMGHSMSLGQCDLATVVSKDAALADAAATQAANLVQSAQDVEPTLNRVAAIDGIDGVLIVKDEHIGMAGKLPPLVKINSH
ncbi:MAG: UPF0280 family protein [Planctomycetota bacterium]|jgi:ApbE superfamily uncharacterized protein (UPF0280 family)